MLPQIVGVLPWKTQSGANDVTDSVPPLIVSDFYGVFQRAWDTDAHFVCYYPVGTEQTQYPRLNKPVLPKMRARGADIVTSMLALDYDNPGHLPWSECAVSLDHVWAKLMGIAQQWPIAMQWAAAYTTKSGLRLVYVLDQHINVELAEGVHQWLSQEFCRRGLAIDCSVSDWTRCYRLPSVMRDNKPTWQEPYWWMQIQPGASIDATSLPTAQRAKGGSVYGEIQKLEAQKPDANECDDVLRVVNPTSGVRVASEWYKQAKKRLKGRECYACLFEMAKIADIGARNPTLHAFVGQATALLWPLQGTTPVHIYAMFLPAVQQLEPDSQTPDWTDVLWDFVCRLWAKEQAKVRVQQEQQQQQSEQLEDIANRLVTNFSKWCRHPVMATEYAAGYISRHAIVSVGNTYYVLGPDGTYEPNPLSGSQVISRLRTNGLHDFVPTQKVGEGGALSDKNVVELINDHSTIVREVRAVPGIRGGVISDIDTPDAVLTVPCYYRRDDLEPTYNKHVDEWLHHLFGDHYDQGCHWISWALAFEEGPICALSLQADQGVGKKMLAQGLAECINTGIYATTKDMTSEHQYGLAASPFLVVNEGWPATWRGMHPADAFRHLTGGDPFTINKKFLAPMHIRNPVRILFTANNSNVVQMLTGGKNLSPQDREALAIRLLHLNLTPTAGDWLRRMGGRSFTGQVGRRWIAGDGTGASDFVLAKHFLWMHATRKGPLGSRFLVEGNQDSEVLWEMRTKSGKSGIVIETIIKLLNCPKLGSGIVVRNDCVFILTSTVLDYYRLALSQQAKESLSMRDVTEVLKGLVIEPTESPMIVEGAESLGPRRWHKLDIQLLLSVACRDGWGCPRLEHIIRSKEFKQMQAGVPR